MTVQKKSEPFSNRGPLLASVAVLFALGACSEPIDLDMRGKIGGPVDTSEAALAATESRPEPDNRGVISYPNYQVAVAKRSDTIATLAQRLGLPAKELADYNGMMIDDPLRQGELVALPRRVSEPSPATGSASTGPITPVPSVDVTTLAGGAIDRAAPTTPQKPEPAADSSGVEPVRHKVARGETAFTIARLYDVSPRSLAEWNGLDKNFTLREGQYLLIPVVQKLQQKPAGTSVPGAGSSTPTPPSASKPLPATTPPPASSAAAGAASGEAAKPVADIGQSKPSAAAMIMPVKGNIVRDYAKGRNEGIDISASAGTAVQAAAAGTVASISTTAEGVKFLLIRHPDDVITVYTHLDNISVKKGDSVKRGQSIGKVRPGDPSFLHFEVRKGFESTDPMGYLR